MTVKISEPILSVRDLSVVFDTDAGPVHAANGVSFDLNEGETLGVVGESGSGKSVTMQAILGLLRVPPARITRGSAVYRGKDLLRLSAEDLRAVRWRDIAMVFQDPMTSLNPVLTIGTQLTEALIEHRSVSSAEAMAEAERVLGLVGIANAPMRLQAYPHQFSGGQLQRIGIAMALICGPSLLIADEPTTALDVTIQAQIVELVVRLQKQLGMAIIWISHDLALVAGLVDRIMVMYGGTVVETASVNGLFASPSHPYTRGLLGSIPALNPDGRRLVAIPGSPPNIMRQPASCAFAPRCTHVAQRCTEERPVLASVAQGHGVACWEFERLPASTQSLKNRVPEHQHGPSETGQPLPILAVRDVKVHFPIRRGILKRQVGAVRAVDGVSFDVYAGETLALVGESGCGKSTTGRAIVGLEPRTAGSVRFKGKDDSDLDANARRERTRQVQMVFQNPYGSLNPRLTIGRVIGEGLRAHRIGSRDDQERRVSELLDLVGLPRRFLSRYPFELSGGQRQRVGIARALATEPRFIIADEPISALDVSIQAQIVNLFADLKEKLDLTYLFIGHDLSMVRHISDRVAVMYLGRIVEIGPTRDVFASPQHPYTRALLSAVPTADPAARGTRDRITLPGAPPDPSRPPPGCRFHPRCPIAVERCRVEQPDLETMGGSGPLGHAAACHLATGGKSVVDKPAAFLPA